MPRHIKDIVGYEGFYKVTDKGHVWSCRRNMFLKQVLSKAGYLRVSLSVNGKHKKASVHRLVAEAFIKNPQNKPTVNHINEIKTDNRVENLEWATNAEQNVHGTRIKRAREHTDYKARKIDYMQIASKHDYVALALRKSKQIYQCDQKGTIIKKFCSIKEASKALNVSSGHICSCLKGRYKMAGGYLWKYAN